MPIRCGWLIADKVVIVEYCGQLVHDEFATIAADPCVVAALDAAAGSQIHFLHIIQEANLKPPKMRVQPRPDIFDHPALGWAIFIKIQHNPLLRMLALVYGQFTRLDFRFCATQAEALAFLHHEVDASLPLEPDGEPTWFAWANWPQALDGAPQPL